MTSSDEFTRMAHKLVDGQIDAGERVKMGWAVHEMLLQLGEIIGPGVERYTFCAKDYLYRVVKSVVDKYDKAEPDDDRQMILPGFERLQKAYTVERDGERQLVPIHLIRKDELLARAREFRKQAGGLIKHAEEIERYVVDHFQERAA